MRQYPRRSSSVAPQNQGIKQSRNRISMRRRRRMVDGATNLSRIGIVYCLSFVCERQKGH